MSSIKLSVSGQRGRTLEDYPDHVTFVTPSKAGDEPKVTLSSVGTIEAVLPRTARLERRRSEQGDSEYVVLVIPHPSSVTLFCAAEEGTQVWPHVEVDVRANQPRFTASLVPDGEVFAVETMFSPTED